MVNSIHEIVGAERIENTGRAVKLRTLGSPEIILKADIPVQLTYVDGDVQAEFVEAEIAVSESTEDDALRWLKESIIDSFKLFRSQRDKLGPVPSRQLQVLEKYLGEKQTT